MKEARRKNMMSISGMISKRVRRRRSGERSFMGRSGFLCRPWPAGTPENIAEPISQLAAGGAGAVIEKTPMTASKAVSLAKPTPVDMLKTAKKTREIGPEEEFVKTGPIEKKITKEEKPLGISLPELSMPMSVRQKVGRTISPMKFQNTTSGGKEIKSEIMSLDKAMYSDINKKYDLSRTLNKNVEDIHPDLVDKLNARLEELKSVPSLSGPRASIKKTMEDVIDSLAIKIPGGDFDYKPISNQSLIDQVQNLREKIDYDFAHGSPKNIIKPVIADINESVMRAAAENPEALRALKDANSSYAEWADLFDNDIVRPFRDKSNKAFSGLYKESTDLDKFNVIKDALSKSVKGAKLSNALRRDIVEKRLIPYLDDLKKTLGEDWRDTLSELEAVVSPKELSDIKMLINKTRKPLGQRFIKKANIKKSLYEKLTAFGSKPENILKVGKMIIPGAEVASAAKNAIDILKG